MTTIKPSVLVVVGDFQTQLPTQLAQSEAHTGGWMDPHPVESVGVDVPEVERVVVDLDHSRVRYGPQEPLLEPLEGGHGGRDEGVAVYPCIDEAPQGIQPGSWERRSRLGHLGYPVIYVGYGDSHPAVHAGQQIDVPQYEVGFGVDVHPSPPGGEYLQTHLGQSEPPLRVLIWVRDRSDADHTLHGGELPGQTFRDVALDPHHSPSGWVRVGGSRSVAIDASVLASAVGVEGVVDPGEPGG